jgi:hypothetical protein
MSAANPNPMEKSMVSVLVVANAGGGSPLPCGVYAGMRRAWVVCHSTVPDLRPWGCLEWEGDIVVVGGITAGLHSFGRGQELLQNFLVGSPFWNLFLLMSLGFVVLMGVRESLGSLVLMLRC